MKPIHFPTTAAESLFTIRQEAVWDDIEHFLDVLKGIFKVLRHEIHVWKFADVIATSEKFVILHNMMVQMNQNGLFQLD